MKHAINELKALLDTWVSQKDNEWLSDIGYSIVVLEKLNEQKWKTVQTQKGIEEDGRIVDVSQNSLDDDLGELDPSKACDLSKEGGCESCQ